MAARPEVGLKTSLDSNGVCVGQNGNRFRWSELRQALRDVHGQGLHAEDQGKRRAFAPGAHQTADAEAVAPAARRRSGFGEVCFG